MSSPAADLPAFLERLEKDGDLRRVRVEVDPYLEVAEITDRVVKAGGPALLFENVKGSAMPLAMNVFGTHARMAKVFGEASLDDVAARIAEVLKPDLPRGIAGLRDAISRFGQLRTVPPKQVKGAACQEVVRTGDDVDLFDLPALHTWAHDGGYFFNLGLTHTKHPETGQRNLGLYRLQRHDKRRIAMHWQIHKDSNAHHAVAERRGERLPVAVAFGCDPVLTYVASAPLPPDIDEYLFAGFLRHERVEMVDAVSVPLQVPASAQVVLEGWIEPGERASEGPFGDHTGFYTPVEPFPVLHVETLTMRKKPVFQSIVVGRPPAEDGPLGKATERIFLPLVKLLIPDIVDFDLPVEGVFHNCVIVSIDKRYPKHAHKVMHAIWGAGMLSLAKLVVVVDAECNVHDYSEVAWRAFGNVDYTHDLVATVGPVDHLDHASYQQFWGGKVGVDATRKLPEEGYSRGWPEIIASDPGVAERVSARWKEYGL